MGLKGQVLCSYNPSRPRKFHEGSNKFGKSVVPKASPDWGFGAQRRHTRFDPRATSSFRSVWFASLVVTNPSECLKVVDLRPASWSVFERVSRAVAIPEIEA